MSKYFVGKWDANDPYRIYSTFRHFEPSKNQRNSVIWRGDDYKEGLEIMKEANRKAKPPPPPKIPRPPAPDPILARQQEDQEKLKRWMEGAKP